MKRSMSALCISLATAGVMTAGLTSASAGEYERQAAPQPQLAPVAAATVNLNTVYVAITPCRIGDTRVARGDFGNLETRSYYVGGTTGFPEQGGKSGGCGIPTTATAVAVSVTAILPKKTGFARFFPSDLSEPTATILNYAQGVSTENGGIASIQAGTTGPSLKVKNYNGPTGMVIDAFGYFAPQIAVSIGSTGNIINGSPLITAVVKNGTGDYTVTVNSDITGCTPVTNSLGGPLGVTTNATVLDANHIQIKTGIPSILGAVLNVVPYDGAVTLSVLC